MDVINYPFGQMAQGAADIAHASKQVVELQSRFQAAMQNLLAAWQSDQGSVQLQQVQQLWTQANEQINQVLSKRGVALDDAAFRMKQADVSAAASLEV